jgi:hypothetical protein
MSRWFFIVVALYAVLLVGGCSQGRSIGVDQHIEQIHDRPIPTDREALRKELAETRDREARLALALDRANNEATQTKIWLGVGACVLAGIVLLVLGVWTTRRILVEIGLGAFALAALGALAAWLVPYILWIGIGLAVIVIGVAVYMLVNREKAVKQIAAGVDDAADRIPEFRDKFKRIFNENIDTNIDYVIKAVRGVK